jgi:NADH dehydrogenase FAD-containing subunit
LIGLCTIRHLKGKADIVLIDGKDFFEYSPGVPHLLMGSCAEKHLIFPMTQVAQGATIIKGKFIGFCLASRNVIVRQNDLDTEIPFDAVVLCTGKPYTAPIRPAPEVTSFEDRLKDIRLFKSQFKEAKHIIVAGGGLVGVELVAEISERLKSTIEKVTLISRSSILASLPAATERYALNWLKKQKNVQLLLGDEIASQPSEGIYLTKSGQEIKADMLIDCTFAPSVVKAAAPAITDTDRGNSVSYGSTEDAATKVSSSSDAANSPTGRTSKDGQPIVWPYDSRGSILVNENMKVRKDLLIYLLIPTFFITTVFSC